MKRRGSRRKLVFLAAAVAAFGVLMAGAGTSGAVGGPTFWKVDLHQHSAFSGDARADIGIDAALDKLNGYNAAFITDHDRMASFQIQGANGNFIAYTDDDLTPPSRWLSKTVGTGATSPAAVSSPVHSGTRSLHLAATATSAPVRSFVYAKRGVGFRSGAITLDFWSYPTTVDSGSGLDVSLALGGDSQSGVSTYGYTTADGTAHVDKSTVLVWQIGSARAASSNGTTDVYTNALPYTANAWNHYTIDVGSGSVHWSDGTNSSSTSSTGINALPTSDQPNVYDVLGYVTMQASAANGTADGYFDDFSLQASSPNCPAADFVYRNGLIDSGQFNTSTFKMFPGREMGQNNHSNQFNFDITSAGDYDDTYADGVQDDQALCGSHPSAAWKFNYYGTDNIPGVQASGYPAQDNHPGVTDTTNDVVSTLAHGADTVEVRTGGDYSATWDAILQQNHPIVGTYGSDAHEGIGSTTPASFIDAPSLALNDLLHSLFEGRLFMAPANFGGRIIFNLDGGPSPYPARYPVYVPAAQTSASASLAINGGLVAGEKVVWIYSNNGGADQTITDTVSGSTYSAAKTIPLTGAFTYVRGAVTDSSGGLIANTEPIFFEDVSGMTAGTSARVDSITAPGGTCSCTVALTKGITSAAWTGSTSTLALTLTNPTASTTELRIPSAKAPGSVVVDGASLASAGSLGAYQAAGTSSWYYDASAGLLYLRDAQASGASHIAVALTGASGGSGGGTGGSGGGGGTGGSVGGSGTGATTSTATTTTTTTATTTTATTATTTLPGAPGAGSSSMPVQCTLNARVPVSWVRGRILLSLRTSAGSGNRGEAILRNGKILGTGVTGGQSSLPISINTRLMPSNRYSRVIAFVYTNGSRACMVKTGLKVDNREPLFRLLKVHRTRGGSLITLRTSETVRVSFTEGARKLSTLTARGGRTVTLRLPVAVRAGTLELVDRAGNRVTRRIVWR
jgi:hypothetical protein